jgi:hypothetical protein
MLRDAPIIYAWISWRWSLRDLLRVAGRQLAVANFPD